MAEIPGFHCRGMDSILGRKTKIPYALQLGQKNRFCVSLCVYLYIYVLCAELLQFSRSVVSNSL